MTLSIEESALHPGFRAIPLEDSPSSDSDSSSLPSPEGRRRRRVTRYPPPPMEEPLCDIARKEQCISRIVAAQMLTLGIVLLSFEILSANSPPLSRILAGITSIALTALGMRFFPALDYSKRENVVKYLEARDLDALDKAYPDLAKLVRYKYITPEEKSYLDHYANEHERILSESPISPFLTPLTGNVAQRFRDLHTQFCEVRRMHDNLRDRIILRISSNAASESGNVV